MKLNRGSTNLDNTVPDHIVIKNQTIFDHGAVYKQPVKSLLFMNKQLNIETKLAF